MVVPRLVGGDCPPVDHVEEHARFKHMLFTPVHCPGSTDCTRPLNFAGMLSHSNRKARFGAGNRKTARSVQNSSPKGHEPVPQLVASGNKQ